MPIIDDLLIFFANKLLLARQLPRQTLGDQAKGQKPIPDPRSPNPEARVPSCWHVVLRTIVRVIAGPAAKARRTFLRAAGEPWQKSRIYPNIFTPAASRA